MFPVRFAGAIIGGTGIGDRLLELGGEPFQVETKAGLFQAHTVTFGGKEILLVSRHGDGHKVPPHRVNYAAIALGLFELGISVCFATAAVGSLRPDWLPGTFAACTDTIDVSARRLTLFSDTVRHTDFTHPFPAHSRLVAAADALGESVATEAVYVNVDGPRYESPAEIRAYRGMGGDLVGMTAGSEAILMAEAGVAYGCLAIVTNLAAGLGSGTLAHGEVTDVMQGAAPKALKILEAAVAAL
jgi:5'-methylthioadenosine phosphorylase